MAFMACTLMLGRWQGWVLLQRTDGKWCRLASGLRLNASHSGMLAHCDSTVMSSELESWMSKPRKPACCRMCAARASHADMKASRTSCGTQKCCRFTNAAFVAAGAPALLADVLGCDTGSSVAWPRTWLSTGAACISNCSFEWSWHARTGPNVQTFAWQAIQTALHMHRTCRGLGDCQVLAAPSSPRLASEHWQVWVPALTFAWWAGDIANRAWPHACAYGAGNTLQDCIALNAMSGQQALR